jgi:hypothetical protein
MRVSAEPTIAARKPQKRLPDFFIVGHPKSGTTALYEMLRRHPQIHMPVKEPRYFTPELRSRFRALAPSTAPDTLEEYLALFAQAAPDQRIGEATPMYLRSPDAASRIAAVQPDARIIAILREPASFLRSFHRQCVHNYIETQTDFRKAIALEEPRRRGRRVPRFSLSPQTLLYSDHVRYVEQLRRFHSVFPPENVMVLIYDDFRRDNEATVRRVLRFLEVDDGFPVEQVETGSVPDVRFVLLDQLTRALSIAARRPATGPVSRAAKGLTPRALRGGSFPAIWNRIVYRPPRPTDEQLMLELRRRFKPEVVALSEYLDRDLVALWGYDSLG